MATNRDLLKEAIADAKAVKEMAIANAKSALEEAFTPRIKEMFSAKLHEMDSEEELEEMMKDEMEEAYLDMDPKGPTAHGNIEEKEHDTMEEELNLEELLAELEEDETSLNEAEEEEETDEEEVEEEGEPLDLEDMTDEDLKKMIEDVIADMIEAGELEAGEGEEGEEEESEEGEEMEMSDEEEVNLDELLREIEEEEMYEEKEDLQEFSLGLNDMEAAISMIAPALAIATGFAVNVIKSRLAKAKSAKELKAEMERVAKEADSSKEVEEAYSTIESLRSDLNEVNLLNAKLLYSNKIFKAKNLNESQKVKVLSSFDKANTVGEVKLVFETLNEGLKVKNTIKENRGSASKSTIVPTTKKPIVESNDAFARMQQLAFYKSEQ
jgi:hypothetical protein